MKTFLLFFYLFAVVTTTLIGQTNGFTPRDVAGKIALLQKQLGLTVAQTNQLKIILIAANKKFEKIELVYKGDINKMIVKIAPLRTETINKIKVLLTAGQVTKFDGFLNQLNNTGNGVYIKGAVPSYRP